MSYETIARAIRAERDRVEPTNEEIEQGKQRTADAVRELTRHHLPRKDEAQ